MIQAREPPSARITRRSWQLSPSSSSFSREPGPRLGGIREVELGGQLGALGAMADHSRVGAIAGQRQQRIDQKRLAGAGFSRDDSQSAIEREFDGADDGEILEGEVAEHGVAQFCLKPMAIRSEEGADCRQGKPSRPGIAARPGMTDLRRRGSGLIYDR